VSHRAIEREPGTGEQLLGVPCDCGIGADHDRLGPFPVPTRREPRGAFPAHADTPRPLLTLEQAARMARDRLQCWRRDHGH
jgi:hypothetical protein